MVPPAEPLRGKCCQAAGVCWQLGFVLPLTSVRAFAAGGSLAGLGAFFCGKKRSPSGYGLRAGEWVTAKGSGLGRLTHGAGSVVGGTLIYHQRVPTDGARRLGCAGILVLCSRLPASGLSRPEARWPDKVLFSAEKSGALRASGLRAGVEMGWGVSGEGLWVSLLCRVVFLCS